MGIRKKINLVIYRFKERGLEVFMINNNPEDESQWAMPSGEIEDDNSKALTQEDNYIELDPVKDEKGGEEGAIAVEGEWHDIPSLKAMLIEDAAMLKEKFKDLEKGTFLAVREAAKKMLPQYQYEFLKELKDIMTDRNSTKDM